MGICPCDVLCIACVRVLNGSFSASCLVKGDSDGCVGGGGGGGRNSKDEMLGGGEKKKRNEGLAR